ncbi:pyridoxal phosphate-dependent aminotransferase [Lacrimispora sp.]|uniref:pyridoxal phosphate-dependent aminotransferase n=1 Tax=Lacrimispora sp. TaxID=2719234 RepID=UPI002FDB3265
MGFKIADRMKGLVPSGIRKVNEKALAMERAGETVIHFEIGRPDFDTPEYIKEACAESLKKGEVFYTSNFGDMKLREQVAEYLERQNHIFYKAEEILITAGLSEAVYDVLCALLDAGDEILVPDPVWINYLNVPKLLGAEPVCYDLLEENGYQPDIKQLEALITDKTKAMVINTPGNPTGSIFSRKTLEEVAALAEKYDLAIISDEIYDRLLYDDAEHVSIASLPGMKERTVTFNGFSKAYSMTGWRLGYVAAPSELIQELNKVHQHITVCAASFVQKAGIAALRDESSEVEDMVKEYQRRRDYAVQVINNTPGIHCLSPKGAFYIFINVKSLGIPSSQVVEYLLEHQKIALVPGDVFGNNGAGYVRMSFANSYENIVEGCRRLAEGIIELRMQTGEKEV